MKKSIIATTMVLLATFAINTTNATNPSNADSVVRSQIEAKYKGAVIIEMEREDGKIKAEIIHDQKEKDVVSSTQGVWQSTKFDISKSELPQKIKEVIKASQYSSYSIDNVEVIETPTQSMYEIELDKWYNSDEVTIYITFDGKLL